MTRLAPHHERRAERSPPALLVRWRVGLGPNLDQSTLECALMRADDGWTLDAALIEREGARERVLQRCAIHPVEVRVADDPRLALTHIDVFNDRAEPLLAVTLRSGDDTPSILYARTSLVARFGVRGGRYEPLDARTTPQPLFTR